MTPMRRGATGKENHHSNPWDKRYEENVWPSEPDQALVDLAGDLPIGSVLDLGCGPGRNSIWLARRGWQVLGVDASFVGLAQAKERAHEAGTTISTVQCDLLAFDPGEQRFDLVIHANIHLGEPQRSQLFAIAQRSLAPSGHLFLTGHHVDDLGRVGPLDPALLYDEKLLSDKFPHLVIEKLKREERVTDNGEHSLSDVVLWARAKP